MMNIYSILPQLPGVESPPEQTFAEQMRDAWEFSGIMRWPLGLCVLIGVVVIIWKFFDIFMKSGATRKILREVDELLAQQQIKDALELTRESNSPAANILHAGLERRDEGTDRVMKAIENQGWVSASGAATSPLKATIIDRYGNQHQVDKFTFQGRQDLEIYVQGQRRLVELVKVARLRFEGERSDEEQRVMLVFRNGAQEAGLMVTGGSSAPHQDAVGGGSSGRRFAGVTELGPFFILASDVQEIVLRHPIGEEPPEEKILKATIITTNGRRFEVENLRFHGKQRLDFFKGRNKKRFIPLDKVARIDFEDGGMGDEIRPITATYWSGKTVMGTVEASLVRLSGETDKSYFERVNQAFTGVMGSSPFAIGMHHIKQIRFREDKDEESAEGGADDTGDSTGDSVDDSAEDSQ
jgi:hypothetical protein